MSRDGQRRLFGDLPPGQRWLALFVTAAIGLIGLGAIETVFLLAWG
jgi:hypothetical protein